MRAAEDSSAPAEDGSPSGVAGDGRGDCSIHKLGLKESEKQGTSWKAMGNRSHTHHQLSVVGGAGGLPECCLTWPCHIELDPELAGV